MPDFPLHEDPQENPLPEPVDENGPQPESSEFDIPSWLSGPTPRLTPGLQTQSIISEIDANAEAASAAAAEAYAVEIRQKLLSEQAEKKPGGARGLVTRMTGSLRKFTGTLRGKTTPLPETPDSQEETSLPALPDLADDFVSDRLGSLQTDLALPEDRMLLDLTEEEEAAINESSDQSVIALPSPDSDRFSLLPGLDAAVPAAEEEVPEWKTIEPAEPTAEPFTLAFTVDEPDWMADIRDDQSRPSDRPQVEAELPRGKTASLRSFITDILSGDGKNSQEQLPDDLLAGRLERSLSTDPAPGASALPVSREEEQRKLEDFLATLQIPDEAPDADALGSVFDLSKEPEVDPFATPDEEPLTDEDAAFLHRLLSQDRGANGSHGFHDAHATKGISESEEPLAGSLAGNKAFASDAPAEDTAGEEDPFSGVSDVEVNGVPDGWTPGKTHPFVAFPEMAQTEEEAASIAFITGREVPVAPKEQAGSDRLLRKVLSESGETDKPEDFEDLRSIALEDYPEARPAWVTEEVEADAPDLPDMEEDFFAEEAQSESGNELRRMIEEADEEDIGRETPGRWARYKAWFAQRKPFEKFLLVEAAVVLMAAVIAVPIFMFIIVRGVVNYAQGRTPAPVYSQAPRPLPSNLPYPTGITLPGGWSFSLAKSTFVEGQWQPQGGEWLEGTEVRRVVALPWNRQTEAVIQSFAPGDSIELVLSNKDVVHYEVSQVERLPASDTQVLSDKKKSLVIILYEEKSDERWVVFCEPSSIFLFRP